ncbi:Uncharacterised protein [Streptococcus pneumoniae]|uniref:Uncharacterized protein n=1 Tax=Streptococcus pneumoniae TaxID=1313 RepID=A0A4J2G076_STREE|nr:Uncharacterised protein [Streptococcus pneumoniae]VLX86250.1 Uncharacterised protein [Streptococcus pneumoniae]VMK39852.1 Uncharacterised protein [Streptococcus pneumoniae]VMP02909.1 Uncharacterised protein [Streptococcus pneumoniae]VNG20057.1 Uncharacterised protein [Streptococcus pneumoniae]
MFFTSHLKRYINRYEKATFFALKTSHTNNLRVTSLAGNSYPYYQAKIVLETNDISLAGKIYANLGALDFKKSNVELKEQLSNDSYDILISIENDKEISILDIEAFLLNEDKNLKIKEFKLKNYMKS